jgi:hypothetical protein
VTEPAIYDIAYPIRDRPPPSQLRLYVLQPSFRREQADHLAEKERIAFGLAMDCGRHARTGDAPGGQLDEARDVRLRETL